MCSMYSALEHHWVTVVESCLAARGNVVEKSGALSPRTELYLSPNTHPTQAHHHHSTVVAEPSLLHLAYLASVEIVVDSVYDTIYYFVLTVFGTILDSVHMRFPYGGSRPVEPSSPLEWRACRFQALGTGGEAISTPERSQQAEDVFGRAHCWAHRRGQYGSSPDDRRGAGTMAKWQNPSYRHPPQTGGK